MGLFYTGKGDGGQSNIGGKKIDKTCVEMRSLGELDELNSLLGLARTQKISAKTKAILKDIQQDLFIVQANIGALLFGNEWPAPPLLPEKIKKLEQWIDDFEKKVKPARGFIIAGENQASAWLDLARTVSRRAEREVLVVAKEQAIDANVLAYMNRLSSLMFALARLEAKKRKTKEEHPRYN